MRWHNWTVEFREVRTGRASSTRVHAPTNRRACALVRESSKPERIAILKVRMID